MPLGWLDTRRPLDPDRVDTDLRTIIQCRLHGLTLVRPALDEWHVFFPLRPVFGIEIQVHKRRHRIVFRCGQADWSTWCRHVVRSELGALYDGECGDDGLDRTWTPQPALWPTYESFVRSTHRREIDRSGDEIVRTLLADVPASLR